MSEPHFQRQSEPKSHSLWYEAPAWRNLTIAALLLTSLSVVLSELQQTAPMVRPVNGEQMQAATKSTTTSDLPIGAIIASRGVLTKVGEHWRVDTKGQDRLLTIEVISPPTHGTITSQLNKAPTKLTNGVTRISQVTDVFYQSEPGYTGLDSFSYVRRSDDPEDSSNSKLISVNIGVQ